MFSLVMCTTREEAHTWFWIWKAIRAMFRYAALTIYCVTYVKNLSKLKGKPTSFPETLCKRRLCNSDSFSNNLWYEKMYCFVLTALQIQC